MKKLILLISLLAIFFAGYTQYEDVLPIKTSSLASDTIRVVKDGESALMLRSTLQSDLTDTTNAHLIRIEALEGAGGNVTKVGTPVNGQIGLWTGDGTMKGDANLTFDYYGTDLLVIGQVGSQYNVMDVARVQLHGDAVNPGFQSNMNSNSAGNLNTYYRGGGTIASPIAAPTDASMLITQYYAHDGTTNRVAAEYEVLVDGSIATDDFDAKYMWSLKEGVGAPVEKMSLDVDGLTIQEGLDVGGSATNFTGLGSDDAEDHVLAIDDGTGLLTKRSVASLPGGVQISGTPTATNLAIWDDPSSVGDDDELYWVELDDVLVVGNNGRISRGRGFVSDKLYDPSTPYTNGGHAFSDDNEITMNATGGYTSYDARALFSGTLDVNHHAGYQVRTAYNCTAAVDRLVGFQSLMSTDAGAGITTQHSGFVMRNPGGSGVITNLFGIHIERLTRGGTTNALIRLGGSYADPATVTDVDMDLISLAVTGSPTIEWDESEDGFAFTKSVAVDGAISQTPISHSLTDGAPTDAEIDSATGTTPATAGSGWKRLILDSDGSALMYIIISDGSNWQYTTMTIAL